MRIPITEIWNFVDQANDLEVTWICDLHIGEVSVEALTVQDLGEIRDSERFDTELLPEIFTFREILWQPDVFQNSPQVITPVRILASYCQDQMREYEQGNDSYEKLMKELLQGVVNICERCITNLEKSMEFHSILRQFRQSLFPIIKFLVHHPANRKDYRDDAIHRLNYAVKVLLSELNGRYSDMEEAYGEFLVNGKKQKVSKSV